MTYNTKYLSDDMIDILAMKTWEIMSLNQKDQDWHSVTLAKPPILYQLCTLAEEKELVRYIHLNPLRAGIVKEMAALDRYRWCGHSVIMKKHKNDWQDREYVLQWFGKKEGEAKNSYRAFVKKGIELGKRPDLTGGGLIRSMGGWSVVKAMRKSGVKEEGDDRILGSGKFVSEMIGQAEEKIKYQLPADDLGKTIKEEILQHCRKEKITPDILQSGSRLSPLPEIRKAIALKLVNDYGVSLAETARQLGISTSGVGQIIKRGRE